MNTISKIRFRTKRTVRRPFLRKIDSKLLLLTMPIFTAPDPIPDNVPPDINITLDKYSFGKVKWDVPRFINCITASQRIKQDRREGQDEIY
jgi:hypothetical protein